MPTIKKPQKQGSEVEIVVAQLLGILMKQVKEQKLKKTKKSVDEEKSQQGSYKRVCPWECLGQVSSLRKPLATSTQSYGHIRHHSKWFSMLMIHFSSWNLRERWRRPFKNWEDFKLRVREQFMEGRDGWNILSHEFGKLDLYISKYK